MSGGGSGDQPASSTTITKPFPAQEKALTELFGMSQAAFDAGSDQYYPGSAVANQSFNTATAQQLGLDAAGIQGGLGMNAASALNAAFDPNSAQSRAIIDPFTAKLQSQILPGIGSQAIQQGAFGGDRQRIQEQSAADSTATAATQAYLQNQQNAIQNLGTVQSGLLDRFRFEQEAPQTALDRLASRITGINLGNISNSATQRSGGGGVDLGGVAGLGLAAAGLFGGK